MQVFVAESLESERGAPVEKDPIVVRWIIESLSFTFSISCEGI
jgi:hypothetical protein